MDELFLLIGKLYVELVRLQQYAELQQTRVKELESKVSSIELQNQQIKQQKDK